MNFNVDACFTIINFALRIGLVVFIVRRYVIGGIVRAIQEEQQEVEQLQRQQTQIRKQQEELQRQVKQEEQAFQALQVKFEQWDKILQSQHLVAQQQCQERQIEHERIAQKKILFIQQQKLVQEQLPQMLLHAQQDLTQQFAHDAKASQKFYDAVLKVVEK